MVARVLGIAKLDFTTKDGNVVKGTKFHCAFKDESIEGTAVDTFFVNADSSISKMIEGVTINCDVDMTFNQKGRLEGIKLLGNNTAKV
jgi:uncharacterized protein (DUF2147 family)